MTPAVDSVKETRTTLKQIPYLPSEVDAVQQQREQQAVIPKTSLVPVTPQKPVQPESLEFNQIPDTLQDTWQRQETQQAPIPIVKTVTETILDTPQLVDTSTKTDIPNPPYMFATSARTYPIPPILLFGGSSRSYGKTGLFGGYRLKTHKALTVSELASLGTKKQNKKRRKGKDAVSKILF
jgi:hypothetical protein